MAHFAQLDANNVVTQVIVVNNSELGDLPFPDSEPVGVAFCQSLFGADTIWKQTSYNANFRGRYAFVGNIYYSDYDIFISPKPWQNPSFVIDPIKCIWVPPIPRPTDDVYEWNEDLLTWLHVPRPYPSWSLNTDTLKWGPPVPYPSDGKRYLWDEAAQAWNEVTAPSGNM